MHEKVQIGLTAYSKQLSPQLKHKHTNLTPLINSAIICLNYVFNFLGSSNCFIIEFFYHQSTL